MVWLPESYTEVTLPTAAELSAVSTDVGNKANLTTTAKTNLVAAINEVDGECSDLKSALNVVDDVIGLNYGINKFNPSEAVADKTISSANATYGQLVAQNGYTVSGFIPAKKDDTVRWDYSNDVVAEGTALSKPDTVFKIAEYAADKSCLFVSSQWVSVPYTVTNDSTAYVRVNVATKSTNSVLVNGPTTGTITYTPFTYVSKTIDDFKDDVQATIANALIYVEPENKLNRSKIKTDTIIGSSGQEAENNTCFTIDYYIPVENGDMVVYTGINSTGTYYHDGISIIYIALYDENKNFLSRSSGYVNDFVINNASCKYIRMSISNSALSYQKASITLNIVPTAASMTDYFAPYYSCTGIPESVKRSRKVLWLGTSIPTFGYPQILGRICGATVTNNSLGSSQIAKGITSNITETNICGIRNIWGLYALTQTIAEKEAMIADWETIAEEIGDSTELTDSIEGISLGSSYETRVDPYLTGTNAVDLVVINHGYNDSETDAIAPSGYALDPYTLEGAYNWLIKHILEAKPTMGIVIFGHYTDLSSDKETALQNVADRWNIPYYKLRYDLQWANEQKIDTTKRIDSTGEWTTVTETNISVKSMWLGDGIHPIGEASKRIAQVSQNVFTDWLKAYCDKNAE